MMSVPLVSRRALFTPFRTNLSKSPLRVTSTQGGQVQKSNPFTPLQQMIGIVAERSTIPERKIAEWNTILKWSLPIGAIVGALAFFISSKKSENNSPAETTIPVGRRSFIRGIVGFFMATGIGTCVGGYGGMNLGSGNHRGMWMTLSGRIKRFNDAHPGNETKLDALIAYSEKNPVEIFQSLDKVYQRAVATIDRSLLNQPPVREAESILGKETITAPETIRLAQLAIEITRLVQ